MPVEWKATARALDEMIFRAEEAGRRIETEGAELVAHAMAARAPLGPTGQLQAGMSAGVYRGHAGAGPTGPYARRVSLGYHGVDSLGRGPYHQHGNPYAAKAAGDAAGAVYELARRRWEEALRP